MVVVELHTGSLRKLKPATDSSYSRAIVAAWSTTLSSIMTKKQERDHENCDDGLYESLPSTLSSSPDKKRRKLNKKSENGNGNNASNNDNNSSTSYRSTTEKKKNVDPVLLEQAKSRLSKFAARLFDPNRVKGLVEDPITIPLNDEVLKAFGKREKEMDKLRGRGEVYDTKIVDEDENNNTDTANNEKETTTVSSSLSSSSLKPNKKRMNTKVKVKITNLAYRTSQETLTDVCLRFGSVTDVNMILEGKLADNENFHNSGLAFVTFETKDEAQSCLDGLKTLDRRPLRVSLAASRPKISNTGRVVNASLLNAGLSKDISTVCFRCKQVGHIERDCTNPVSKKPCVLCGMTDHDFRACPNNIICFNCGSPGHLSRDCTMRRGLPRRLVCGICFQSGHHRLQCFMRSAKDLPHNVTAPAICMDCGERGHFLCKDLKWFYGLRGVSCFNCGAQDHSGYDCNRPTVYQCLSNPDITTQEIDRAAAESVAEEFERQQREQRERSTNRGRNHQGNSDRKNRRSKSSGFNGKRRDRRGY